MDKNTIDQIKESLSNLELPYDEQVWTSLVSKLDHKMPVKTGRNWLGKSIIAASVVGIGVAAAIYFGTQSEQKTVRQITQNSLENEVKSTDSETKSIQEVNDSVVNSESDKVLTENTTKLNTRKSELNSENRRVKSGVNPFVQPIQSDNNLDVIPAITHPSVGVQNTTISFPTTSSMSYCEGEAVVIKNNSDVIITLISSQGRTYGLKAHDKTTLKNLPVGSYSYQVGSETKMAFELFAKPSIDFTVEDLLYDKGLPFNHVQATGSAPSYGWYDQNGNLLSTKREFDAHFYTRGTHQLTLKAENSAGCVQEIKKNIQIESDYKLLAVTGFDPENANPKLRTFIPFALLERDTPFEMIIMDTKTGETIFKTSDASSPWNGIDPRTNTYVTSGSTYVWKVKLLKPELNESSDYRGTITRLER
jgi:hypothetical protein